MYKVLGAIVVAFGLFAGWKAHAATPMQNGYFMNLDTVKYIQCVSEDGHSAGTAFIVGKDRLITANHVIYGAASCTIDHKKVKLISKSEALDIAVIEVDLGEKPPILEISCDGFTDGQTYFSFGFSRGQDFAMTKMAATGEFEDEPSGEYPFEQNHLSSMVGYMFAGMSGGPIINMDGRVVGVNNMSNEHGQGLSRSLSETMLCDAYRKPEEPLYPMPKKKEANLGFLDLLKNLPQPILPAPAN